MLLLLLLGCPHPAPPPSDPTAVAVALPTFQSVLERGASDVEVPVRRKALAALIHTSAEPAGGAWGQRGRYDPSAYVQRAVITVLQSRIQEPETRALLTSLVQATGADPYVRGMAGLALARADASARALLASAAAAEGGWKAGGLLLAAAVAGDDAAKSRLVQFIERGNLPLDTWFLRELGNSALPELVPPLQAALPRTEEEARLSVAVSLFALAPDAARPTLAEVLASEDEDRALEVLDWLAISPQPEALPLLRQANGTPFIADAAKMVLIGKGEGDLSATFPLLSDPESDPDLRELAILAIDARLHQEPTQRGHARARALVRPYLQSSRTRLVLAAARALSTAPTEDDQAAVLTRLQAEESLALQVDLAAAFLGVRL